MISRHSNNNFNTRLDIYLASLPASPTQLAACGLQYTEKQTFHTVSNRKWGAWKPTTISNFFSECHTPYLGVFAGAAYWLRVCPLTCTVLLLIQNWYSVTSAGNMASKKLLLSVAVKYA